ncbi:MAG: hypothetical protein J6J60_05555 [Clostridia bacterium]|nr:hypothetical protein [Clostridia bacterium]
MKKYFILFLFGILMFELTFLLALHFFEIENDEFVETEIEKVNKLEYFLETEETSIEDESKIGINTQLFIKKKYSNCNHEIESIEKVSNEMINLTKDEFIEEFPEYELKKFSEHEIIVEEKIHGICNEHFKIGLGDEFIEIFKFNSEGEEELYLVTNVLIDYLPKEDIKKLNSGILVYGIDNINSILEDYE